MQHAFASFLIGMTAALPLFAQCAPADLRTELTEAERATIQREVADVPYGIGRAFTAVRGDEELFLFGTLHSAEAGPLPAPLTDALANASQVFVEVTIAENERLARQMQTNPGLIMNMEGDGLLETLSAKEWNVLTTAFEPYGMPAAAVDRLQPWFAGMMLALPACELMNQAQGAQAIDAQIEQIASGQGKPVLGLETAMQAIDALASMPEPVQMDFLRIGISTAEIAEPLFMTVAQIYAEGRIAEVYALSNVFSARVAPMDEVETMSEAVFDALLVGRNNNWMPAILDAAQNGPAVIAVGALHLGGEEGLLRLLEGEGFDITRVNLDGEVSE
ncbi:hypothetical protein SAMN06273572_101571 [Monaibacterium marinum]|uniref:TraB family protein n=1 Tax=Pontivivens marinum TaxID=1690039 RepID=A0A2C9CN97_9RHOB|nr:TraB/GumN family protein [Monaibacterium marinum]SOH92723.1 hypothetical protein SAMN06273572_101571 [Monaibacterium marinum]